MVEATQIIVADDHPLFREALQKVLAPRIPDVCFVEAESFDSLRLAVEANDDADLVLLDLDIPGTTGFSALVWLRDRFPALPVVMISATGDVGIMRRAVNLGASGFIPKSSPVETISEAIAAVLEGEIWLPAAALALDETGAPPMLDEFSRRASTLTPQQRRVLEMLADGLLNKQIAAQLKVSEATVKAHATLIFRKLGVRSRTQAAVAARRLQMPG